MSTTIGCQIPGASQPIQLDENNNFIDPVTGELMHQLTVEEMPRHTFGAELYAPDAIRPTAHWIRVKDRLPVAKEVVLAYESAFDSMSMAFRLPDTEEFINVGDYYALDAVTHWMPLPEPPKEAHND